MLNIYPTNRSLKNKFLHYGGQHFGILESQLLTSTKGRYTPKIDVCTANMPKYEKLILNEEAEINHHLSGYGVFFEEALIRLLGESIERYALMISNTYYRDFVVNASYNEIAKKGEVMAWEYIMMYSQEDYKKIQAVTNVRPITKDDPLNWILCQSLFDKDRQIYIPIQLLFTGYKMAKDEILFAPGFSKGTAAHSTIERALNSAIMEAVEADAFTLAWYAQAPARQVIIDDEEFLQLLEKMLGLVDSEIFVLEYGLEDMPGYAVSVSLLTRNGKRPSVIMGCQADLNPKKAIYKAFLEALAIYYLATNGPLLLPDLYLAHVKGNLYNNLDSNVAYWAKTDDWEKKKKFIKEMPKEKVLLSSLENMEKETTKEEIAQSLSMIRKVSDQAVYLDITPIEVKGEGWHVIRTFFPELVQMSLPSYPYSNHPRMKKHGGVTNELPHPIP